MGGVQSKTQEGSVTQVDFNAATAALEFGSGLGIATSQRVELRLAAKGLPKKDKLSKSDPMAVLYKSGASGQTQWTSVGRTEAVANTTDPAWVRPLLASYSAEALLPMRVVVYDVDSLKSDTKKISLASQDYIGEAEFFIHDVMSAPGQTLELPLTDVESGRALPPNCTVVIKAEQMSPADNRVVRMAFSANGLAKRDKMSESDPFLQVLKLRAVAGSGPDDWVPVFKTEVRDNNPDPVWRPIEVDIRQLCSADETRPLKLQAFDYNSNGLHTLIGEVQTTLAQLRAMAPGPYVGSTLPAAAGVGGAAGTSGAPAAAAAAAAAPVAMATTATDGAAPVGANGAAAVVPAAAASAGIEAPPLPATATKAPAEVPSGRTLDLAPSPPGLGGKVGSLTVRQVQVRAGATPGQVLAGCIPTSLPCLGSAE